MAKGKAVQAPAAGDKTIKLNLPAPRKASGDPAYGISDYVAQQFESVTLVQGNTRVPVIGKGAKAVGSVVLDFISAVLMATFSGRGDVTEGATLWAAEHADNPQLARLKKYNILAISNGRGGTYIGKFDTLLDVARARAKIFGPSIEKYPRRKAQRGTQVGDDVGEVVDVIL